MKRLLVIAFFFPPIGGAGVQRSLKLVRDLPDRGYRPTVVTGPGPAATRWTPSDSDLAAEVPASIEVLRLSQPMPPPAGPWRHRLHRWLRLREAFSRWWEDGVASIGRRLDVDVIYASMSPFESGAVAARLSDELGVPWVADLRDPWALDEVMVYPSAVHRALERHRMGRVLRRADAVVMNTPEAAHKVIEAFPDLDRRRVTSIPNGYAAQDFAQPEPIRRDGRFRIVHTGYLHTELGLRQRRSPSRLLRGARRGLDLLPRSHVFLLDALDSLAARDPLLGEDVEVVLAGVLSPTDESLCQGRAVPIRLPGYVNHVRSVELLRSADLLFLPMHDLAPEQRASIVPGKTYEYLASGRPILAAVPHGDARDLLSASGRADICAPADAGAIAAAIEAAVTRFRRDGHPPTAPVDDVAAYERKHLSARMADVLDLVTAPRGRPPAASRRHGAHRG